MLYIPSHLHPNLASVQANQDSPSLVFQLSHLSMGHLLNFYFLKCKSYSWFKDSTHYYWPVPTNYTCFDRNKNANVPTEPGWQHAIFYLLHLGRFLWSQKQATTCTSNKNKMPTFQKVTKAPLPSGDKTENVQMLLLYCYIDTFCAWRASSLNMI